MPLKAILIGHEVETAYERGWNDLKNGDLLSQAESANFEVLLTTDQSIRYQQNLTNRRITIVVLRTTDWTRIRRSAELITEALNKLPASNYLEIDFPR